MSPVTGVQTGYIPQAYPKSKFHISGRVGVAKNPAHETESFANDEWSDVPFPELPKPAPPPPHPTIEAITNQCVSLTNQYVSLEARVVVLQTQVELLRASLEPASMEPAAAPKKFAK